MEAFSNEEAARSKYSNASSPKMGKTSDQLTQIFLPTGRNTGKKKSDLTKKMTPYSQITRRSFMKRTSFTAASLLVLSQGIALANPENASTGGCPQTQFRTKSNQKEKTTRIDEYQKYKSNVSGVGDVYLVAQGEITQDADSQLPPGNYDPTFTVMNGNLSCLYTRKGAATHDVFADSGLIKQGSSHLTPAFAALPLPHTQWTYVNSTPITFKRTRTWNSSQEYSFTLP